jgi:hypothetical protein
MFVFPYYISTNANATEYQSTYRNSGTAANLVCGSFPFLCRSDYHVSIY